MTFRPPHAAPSSLATSILAMVLTASCVVMAHAQTEDPPALLLYWGRGGSLPGQFANPVDLAVSTDGFVYVADTGNHRIQKFASDSTFILSWGTFGSGPGQFNSPTGVAVDPSGNVYVADASNNRIQRFDAGGVFIQQWSSPSAIGLEVDPTGAFLYVVAADSVRQYTTSGVRLTAWRTFASNFTLWDVAVGPTGHSYVTATYDNEVRKYFSVALVASWSGTGDGQLFHPTGIAVDSQDHVYVADVDWVRKFSSGGTFLSRWGGHGGLPGQFISPYGVAVDSDGNIYVVDNSTNRVQKFGDTPTPAQKTTWGRIKAGYRQPGRGGSR